MEFAFCVSIFGNGFLFDSSDGSHISVLPAGPQQILVNFLGMCGRQVHFPPEISLSQSLVGMEEGMK